MVSYFRLLRNEAFQRLQALGMSVSSLHGESTDSLIICTRDMHDMQALCQNVIHFSSFSSAAHTANSMKRRYYIIIG